MDVAGPPRAEAPPELGHGPQPRSPRRALTKLVVVLAAFALLAGGAALYVRDVADGSSGPSRPVTVVVPKGASAAQIADMLAEGGVIRNAWLFRLMARLDGRAGTLKAGKYELRTGMSYGAVLSLLEAGPVVEVETFTIPEGETIREVVDIIRRKTSLSAAAFEAEIRSGRHRLPIMPAGSTNLEGLLFPKTYEITEEMTEADALRLMLDQFVEETRGLDFAAAPHGLSPYQTIVLASLVEREAKVPEDRAKIAGVIYNRLRRGMRLQIDATVQYAILQATGAYKPRLTFADYEIDSPYNTYRIDGLPPAPIAGPGLASIVAALKPAATDAIYYVLCDKRGAHAFARTADEFARLKRECAAKR